MQESVFGRTDHRDVKEKKLARSTTDTVVMALALWVVGTLFIIYTVESCNTVRWR